MSPETIFRDGKARHAAIERYALAHDHFAEEEQLYRAQGEPIKAEGARLHAEWVKRAWVAEETNPEPKEPA